MLIFESTISEHFRYVQDGVRVQAYGAALEKIISPDHIVLDLGSGTGLMGLLACRAGAQHVYSIESDPVIELAKQLARDNGYSGRITFVRGFSRNVSLPDQVDVVVADQLGLVGFESGLMVPSFEDVRRRLLKPDGILVPSDVDILLAPIQDQHNWSSIEFWDTRPAGFQFSPARKYAVSSAYAARTTKEELLSPPKVGATVSLRDVVPETLITFGETFQIERAGTLNGVMGAFVAHLAPGVQISNSPTASNRISRANLYLPVDEAVEVSPGDEVQISGQLMPDEYVTWQVECVGGGKLRKVFRHCSVLGEPIGPEELAKLNPHHCPTLAQSGIELRAVLEMCSGHASLEQIQQELLARFPSRFISAKDAGSFLATIVRSFAQ